jgi:hypothetical protein
MPNQISRPPNLVRLNEWGNIVAGSALERAAAEQITGSILPLGPSERIQGNEWM